MNFKNTASIGLSYTASQCKGEVIHDKVSVFLRSSHELSLSEVKHSSHRSCRAPSAAITSSHLHGGCSPTTCAPGSAPFHPVHAGNWAGIPGNTVDMAHPPDPSHTKAHPISARVTRDTTRTRPDGAYLPCVRDCEAVQGPDGHVHNLLPSQSFHHLRLPHVHVGAMAQTEVIPLSPVRSHKRISGP